MNLASPEYDICTVVPRANGTRAAYIRNAGSNVVTVNFGSPTSLPAVVADVFDFLDEFDQSPAVSDFLPDARREVGAALEAVEGLTLRTLRMRKGLSQQDLAAAIGTSQAAVSSIENRNRKPGEDNLRALASVLEIDFNTLMEALDNG